MDKYDNIPKKKGFIYRGISNQEFENAKEKKYFRSHSTYFGTYASDNPYTAECYAEYLAPKGKVSTLKRPTYVIVFKENELTVLSSKNMSGFITFCKKLNLINKTKNITYWQSFFKEHVSGDDHLIIGKVPFNKTKEIYKFNMGHWMRIK